MENNNQQGRSEMLPQARCNLVLSQYRAGKISALAAIDELAILGEGIIELLSEMLKPVDAAIDEIHAIEAARAKVQRPVKQAG